MHRFNTEHVLQNILTKSGSALCTYTIKNMNTHTPLLQPLFQNDLGEPIPESNCNGVAWWHNTLSVCNQTFPVTVPRIYNSLSDTVVRASFFTNFGSISDHPVS